MGHDLSVRLQATQYAYGTGSSTKVQSPTDKKIELLSKEKIKDIGEAYLKDATTPQQAIGEDRVFWHNLVATDKELDTFQDLIAPDGAFRQLIENSLQKFGEGRTVKLLKMVLDDKHPFEKLPDAYGENTVTKPFADGKLLLIEEQQALFIYSSHLYNAFNCTLGKKDQFLEDFMKKNEIPLEKKSELQNCSLQISTVIASALNKLPPFEGPLYRGDALSKDQLEAYSQGKMIVDPKFLSFSLDPDECTDFAQSTAIKKKENFGTDTTPVVFVIESTRAKEISDFSLTATEKEALYCPGQAFESLGATKGQGDLEGFTVITLREVNPKE